MFPAPPGGLDVGGLRVPPPAVPARGRSGEHVLVFNFKLAVP